MDGYGYYVPLNVLSAFTGVMICNKVYHGLRLRVYYIDVCGVFDDFFNLIHNSDKHQNGSVSETSKI